MFYCPNIRSVIWYAVPGFFKSVVEVQRRGPAPAAMVIYHYFSYTKRLLNLQLKFLVLGAGNIIKAICLKYFLNNFNSSSP